MLHHSATCLPVLCGLVTLGGSMGVDNRHATNTHAEEIIQNSSVISSPQFISPFSLHVGNLTKSRPNGDEQAQCMSLAFDRRSIFPISKFNFSKPQVLTYFWAPYSYTFEFRVPCICCFNVSFSSKFWFSDSFLRYASTLLCAK